MQKNKKHLALLLEEINSTGTGSYNSVGKAELSLRPESGKVVTLQLPLAAPAATVCCVMQQGSHLFTPQAGCCFHWRSSILY